MIRGSCWDSPLYAVSRVVRYEDEQDREHDQHAAFIGFRLVLEETS